LYVLFKIIFIYVFILADVKHEEIKRKDEEIKRKDEENSELKKHLGESDKKLRKEIYRISKTAWHDFVGEDFEVENGVLELE
jgi:predicted membrane protein